MSVSHRVKRKRSADGSASVARKDMLVKVGKGRGRKIAPWAFDVQRNLVAEFERLTKKGLKINVDILRILAKRILLDPDNDFEFATTLTRAEREQFVLRSVRVGTRFHGTV